MMLGRSFRRHTASAFASCALVGAALVACSSVSSDDPTAAGEDHGDAAAEASSPAGDDGAVPRGDGASTLDGGSGFPDETNTGYEHAPGYPGALTPWGGGAVQDGHTYAFIDFPGGVDVGSQAHARTGVKFVGCRFHGANPGEKLVGIFGTDITFEYCTFEPDVQPPHNVTYAESYQYGIAANGGYYTHAGKLTVEHCDMWGFANAIDVNPTDDPASPQVYRDNWIHHAADVTRDVYHHDGIGAQSGSSKGSYVTLDHNTIESLGNTNAVAYQATGPYTHFVVTRNLFGGFGYAVAILGGATDVTFTDNTFSTRITSVYGPLYPDDFWTTSGSTWRRNRWSVPPGAAWGNPAHDGWFWVPGAGSPADDTGYVSQTDYAK